MANSVETVDSGKDSTNEPSEQSPSLLLLLNDDCLITLFKLLELIDFVNLAKTCVRLMNVARDTPVRRFKSLVINDEYSEYHPLINVRVTKQQFSDILSVVGGRVLSIELFDGYDFLYRTVIDKCKNLNTLSLCTSLTNSLGDRLQECRNLKELRIFDCEISGKTLRQVFINNPDMERLEYDWAYKRFVNLLRLLPKLKSLRLQSIETLENGAVPNLFHLKHVTEFEFGSNINCNEFLLELATKWKLVELEFICDTDHKTFQLIQSFENLEYLKMGNFMRSCTLPEHTIFPPKLKRITLYMDLTYRTLASIVSQLKLLEEIHLGHRCIITDSRPYDDDEKIMGIATTLRPLLKERTLKIFYTKTRNIEDEAVQYFYDSQQLKIANPNYKGDVLKSVKASSIQLLVPFNN